MIGLSDASTLSDTRLILNVAAAVKHKRMMALTGTRKRTPVTIEVKAVPPTTREYKLPSSPITKAPAAEIISVRPGKIILAARLAAKAQQENKTMTGS